MDAFEAREIETERLNVLLGALKELQTLDALPGRAETDVVEALNRLLMTPELTFMDRERLMRNWVRDPYKPLLDHERLWQFFAETASTSTDVLVVFRTSIGTTGKPLSRWRDDNPGEQLMVQVLRTLVRNPTVFLNEAFQELPIAQIVSEIMSPTLHKVIVEELKTLDVDDDLFCFLVYRAATRDKRYSLGTDETAALRVWGEAVGERFGLNHPDPMFSIKFVLSTSNVEEMEERWFRGGVNRHPRTSTTVQLPDMLVPCTPSGIGGYVSDFQYQDALNNWLKDDRTPTPEKTSFLEQCVFSDPAMEDYEKTLQAALTYWEQQHVGDSLVETAKEVLLTANPNAFYRLGATLLTETQGAWPLLIETFIRNPQNHNMVLRDLAYMYTHTGAYPSKEYHKGVDEVLDRLHEDGVLDARTLMMLYTNRINVEKTTKLFLKVVGVDLEHRTYVDTGEALRDMYDSVTGLTWGLLT